MSENVESRKDLARKSSKYPRSILKTNMKEISLQRLGRLITLYREYGNQMNERGVNLLKQSTYSVYVDLRELGLEARAQAMLEQLPNRAPR